MWKDIAVLVNDMSETINGQPVCDYYKENSKKTLLFVDCVVQRMRLLVIWLGTVGRPVLFVLKALE